MGCGVELVDISYANCYSGELTEACVYVSRVAISDEGCPYEKAVFTSTTWGNGFVPLNTLVTSCGETWTVTSSQCQGCAVSLIACRPILSCPNCTVEVFRKVNPANDEFCKDNCGYELAGTFDADLCVIEEIVESINDADFCIEKVRVCTASLVSPGDILKCGDKLYEVDKIENECSSKCAGVVTATTFTGKV